MPEYIQDKAKEMEALFRADSDVSVRDLSGELAGFRLIFIDPSYRIIFELRGAKNATFHSIGNHAIYRKSERKSERLDLWSN